MSSESPHSDGTSPAEFPSPRRSIWGELVIIFLSAIFLILDILLFVEFETTYTGFYGLLLQSAVVNGPSAIALVIMEIWFLLLIAWIVRAQSVRGWVELFSDAIAGRARRRV